MNKELRIKSRIFSPPARGGVRGGGSNHKGFAPIFVILAVAVAAIVAGYFVFKKTPPAQAPAGQIGQPTTASSTAAIDASNWKTFTYKQYEITVKYPPDWRVHPDPKDPQIYVIDSPSSDYEMHNDIGGFVLSFYPLTPILGKIPDLNELADEYGGHGSGVIKTDFALDGVSAEKVTESSDAITQTIVVFEKPNDKNNFYLVNMDASGPDRKMLLSVLDEILSTFKFIEPSGGKDTSGTNINGPFCGGIAGIKCQNGGFCMLDGNYPDAGGHCIVK